jgi:hypothetical protein
MSGGWSRHLEARRTRSLHPYSHPIEPRHNYAAAAAKLAEQHAHAAQERDRWIARLAEQLALECNLPLSVARERVLSVSVSVRIERGLEPEHRLGHAPRRASSSWAHHR